MMLCGLPLPESPRNRDEADDRGFDPTGAPVCRDCKTAIHDGNLCLECARDRRELAIERDREWWSE